MFIYGKVVQNTNMDDWRMMNTYAWVYICIRQLWFYVVDVLMIHMHYILYIKLN